MPKATIMKNNKAIRVVNEIVAELGMNDLAIMIARANNIPLREMEKQLNLSAERIRQKEVNIYELILKTFAKYAIFV